MNTVFSDMENMESIVMEYYNQLIKIKNHRYKSWEHCYQYFNNCHNPQEDDIACLHLAFYLASWGMYRGSSFLLQKDYLFLKPVISVLVKWKTDHPNYSITKTTGDDYAEEIMKLKDLIVANLKYKDNNNEREATDTLVTKIILGTLGIVPAYDRFFINGLKEKKIKHHFNKESLKKLQELAGENTELIKKIQKSIREKSGIKFDYPEMKIFDMYFWQIGSKLK